MKQNISVNEQKLTPPTKKTIALYITEEASSMLDELTTNRSWLVEKWIRDNHARERELTRRGKPQKAEAK